MLMIICSIELLVIEINRRDNRLFFIDWKYARTACTATDIFAWMFCHTIRARCDAFRTDWRERDYCNYIYQELFYGRFIKYFRYIQS